MGSAEPPSFRRAFLERLFARLNAEAIPFCILRNYATLYENTLSDVDMLVEPASLKRVEAIMQEILAACGGEMIRRADFLCRSFIFYAGEQLFHIDLEYCKRWRIFQIISENDLLEGRRPYGAFFVPTPEREAIILWAQAIGAGVLTDRYRAGLERLFSQTTPETLLAVYRKSFGKDGDWLAQAHRELNAQTDTRHYWRRLRRAIVLKAFRRGDCFRDLFRFAGWDIRRMISRLSRISGLRCTVISTEGERFDPQALFELLPVLFPPSKTASRPRLAKGRAERWGDFKHLFRGGILVETLSVPTDEAASRLAAKVAVVRNGWFDAPRALLVNYRSAPPYAVDLASGFGQTLAGGVGVVADFLVRTVGRTHFGKPPEGRGLFCVLLGLDGSGKTSVARALCERAGGRFSGVRYLHWIPSLRTRAVPPLPSFENIPRRPAQAAGPLAALASLARLGKNGVRMALAYAVRITPWRRRGLLVLVDRYFYNYLLDPASVRYSGPRWAVRLAQRLFPKPDLILVLQAEPELLLARKQEVPLEELRRQNEALRRLATAENAVCIDAAAPLPQVVAQARAALEAALEKTRR